MAAGAERELRYTTVSGARARPTLTHLAWSTDRVGGDRGAGASAWLGQSSTGTGLSHSQGTPFSRGTSGPTPRPSGSQARRRRLGPGVPAPPFRPSCPPIRSPAADSQDCLAKLGDAGPSGSADHEPQRHAERGTDGQCGHLHPPDPVPRTEVGQGEGGRRAGRRRCPFWGALTHVGWPAPVSLVCGRRDQSLTRVTLLPTLVSAGGPGAPSTRAPPGQPRDDHPHSRVPDPHPK